MKVRWTELAARLTGVTVGPVGASWNPPEAESAAAQRVLLFLEDRRVLYDPTQMETPSYCVESVLSIRESLTTEIGKRDPYDALGLNLQAMRAACRKFLQESDSLSAYGDDRARYFMSGRSSLVGNADAWHFYAALGELRATFGLHVGLIALRNKLDVENNLASILPGILDDDGNVILAVDE